MLSKLSFVTLILAASCVCAQTATHAVHKTTPVKSPESALPKTSAELSSAILASYYHPDNLTLIDCDLLVDWNAFYHSVKVDVDPDRLRSLQGLKIHSREVRGRPLELHFDWTNGTIATQEQIESGMKQMVGGFYQMYWPMIAGPIVGPGDKLEQIESLPGGGEKTSTKSSGMNISMVLDPSGAPTHYEFEGGAMGGKTDVTYMASPNPAPGDLRRIASMKIDEHIGTSTFNIDLKLDYQNVSGFSIPNRVSFGLVGAYTIDLQFSGCSASTVAVSQ